MGVKTKNRYPLKIIKPGFCIGTILNRTNQILKLDTIPFHEDTHNVQYYNTKILFLDLNARFIYQLANIKEIIKLDVRVSSLLFSNKTDSTAF